MRKAYRTQFVHNFNIYDMKKWFTLIGLCCLMTGMISATNQPLKRISPVQAAQMRLGVLNEGTTRMEGTVRPGDTKTSAGYYRGQPFLRLPRIRRRFGMPFLPTLGSLMEITIFLGMTRRKTNFLFPLRHS